MSIIIGWLGCVHSARSIGEQASSKLISRRRWLRLPYCTCITSSGRFFSPFGCRMARWRKLQPHLSLTLIFAPKTQKKQQHMMRDQAPYTITWALPAASPLDRSRDTVLHAPQLVASSRGEFPLQSMQLRSAPWGGNAQRRSLFAKWV